MRPHTVPITLNHLAHLLTRGRFVSPVPLVAGPLDSALAAKLNIAAPLQFEAGAIHPLLPVCGGFRPVGLRTYVEVWGRQLS